MVDFDPVSDHGEITRLGDIASDSSAETPEHPYHALGGTEIRLVKVLPGDFGDPIELELHPVDLHNEPVYDALSYAWHPCDGTIDTSRPHKFAFIVNHQAYPVALGANLESAIRHLRRPKLDSQGEHIDRPLWVDALCINQDVAAERSHQVGLMRSIYSSAQQVLIWLGPSRYCSDFAMDTLSTGQLEPRELGDFINCLEMLLQREWFGRVWVAQELTLARKSPIVHVGYRTMTWDEFALGVNMVQQRLCSEGRVLGTSRGPYLECLSKEPVPPSLTISALVARAGCVQHLAELRKAGQTAAFSQQFFRTMYLHASDARDKIYGLVGFSTFDEWAISPDYNKSVDQVFAEAAAVIFRQDFCSYIAYQLWEYQRRRLYEQAGPFAGTPVQQLLAITTRPDSTMVPRAAIEQALIRGGHQFIASFSDDFSSFETSGLLMGHVVACDFISFISHSPENLLHSIYRHLYDCGIGLDCKKLLDALLGPSNPHSYDRDAILAFLQDRFDSFVARADMGLIMTRQQVDEPSRLQVMSSNCYEQLKALSVYHGEEAQIFLTDTGLMGLVSSPEWCTSSEVAGLFGIHVPMVMMEVVEDVYRLVDVAYIAGHVPGDNHVDGRELEVMKWYTCLSNGRLDSSL